MSLRDKHLMVSPTLYRRSPADSPSLPAGLGLRAGVTLAARTSTFPARRQHLHTTHYLPPHPPPHYPPRPTPGATPPPPIPGMSIFHSQPFDIAFVCQPNWWQANIAEFWRVVNTIAAPGLGVDDGAVLGEPLARAGGRTRHHLHRWSSFTAPHYRFFAARVVCRGMVSTTQICYTGFAPLHAAASHACAGLPA